MIPTPQKNNVKTYSFNKENNAWYIDFPEFIRQGYGVKADLMMVAGADTLLDMLSNNGRSATVSFSDAPFENQTGVMNKISTDINTRISSLADADCGAYYNVTTYRGKPFQHQLWLCPVTLHIFNGQYPDTIYFRVH